MSQKVSPRVVTLGLPRKVDKMVCNSVQFSCVDNEGGLPGGYLEKYVAAERSTKETTR